MITLHHLHVDAHPNATERWDRLEFYPRAPLHCILRQKIAKNESFVFRKQMQCKVQHCIVNWPLASSPGEEKGPGTLCAHTLVSQ